MQGDVDMSIGEKHFAKKDIQTAMKHDLLEKYIYEWGKILTNSSHSNNLKRVNYVDCFAGKGTFDDGQIGSPILAMNSLFVIQENFKRLYKDSINFHIYTIEYNKEYHHNLCQLKQESKYPNQIHNYYGKFEEHLDSVINKTSGSPSFYFIDPFGYTGLPMDKIVQILHNQSHEVFINVMSYSLVRNLKVSQSHKGLCGFFGIDSLTDDLYTFINQIDKTHNLSEFSKNLYKLEDKIIAFYKDQLKKKYGKELYVLSKRIYSKLNPNVYFHLVFASTNIKGLAKMKEAFVLFEQTKYKIEEEYAVSNNINKSIELNFFDDFLEADTYEYKDFLYELKSHFNNKELNYKDIVVHFLENSPLPYRDKNSKGIYDFIKKIEKNKKCFNRSKGTIADLSKIDKISVNLNLSDTMINELLKISNTKQLTLF